METRSQLDVADPIAVMHSLYQRRGLSYTLAFEDAMRAWLTNNDSARYGRFPYSYDGLGVTEAEVAEMFADYSKQFGLG